MWSVIASSGIGGIGIMDGSWLLGAALVGLLIVSAAAIITMELRERLEELCRADPRLRTLVITRIFALSAPLANEEPGILLETAGFRSSPAAKDARL